MWFYYAFIFAIVTSFSVVVAKKIMVKSDEYFYLWLTNLFTIPFLLVTVLAFFEIPKIDIIFSLSIFASVCLSVIAAVLAYRAIKISDVSIVSPISAFNPVFTAGISYLALGEKITTRGFWGILLVVAGSYLLSLPKSKIGKGLLAPIKALILHKGVQMSFVAYFLWAVTPILEKTAILHTNPQTPAFVPFIGTIVSTLFFTFLVLRFSKNILANVKKYFVFGILIAILGTVGSISGITAFSLGNLGYVTAVFKLSMLITVILGWLFFKERNIKERILGSFVMLIGVILLVS